MVRTYSELCRLPTFAERLDYLMLFGRVGNETFADDRYLNQRFYTSNEWRAVRRHIIARDLGRDLAVLDLPEITGTIVVHHMNPITVDDVLEHSNMLLDPEFLVCTSESTHKLIHYGYESYQDRFMLNERKAGDTCPWR